MATKQPEPCPKCGSATLPTDKAIPCDSEYGTFPVRMWRYECGTCDWSWANKFQRKHNQDALIRARRDFLKYVKYGG